MASSFGRVRPIAAAAIGIGSILAGLILAFRLVTPGVVERLSNRRAVAAGGFQTRGNHTQVLFAEPDHQLGECRSGVDDSSVYELDRLHVGDNDNMFSRCQ